MGWVVLYFIGTGVTAYMLTWFGWLPGTPKWKRIAVTAFFIACWPAFLVLMLLTGIDQIGSRPH